MSIIHDIEKRVCVKPDCLNSKIRSYLLQKSKEYYINDCTKDLVYIIDIKKLVKIKDNFLSNSCSDIVFEIILKVETIKPDVGMVFNGKVCMIFQDGILVNIKEIMKVLIPVSVLKNYELENNIFIYKGGGEDDKVKRNEIKINDIIDVVIIGSKYSKKKYSCFGNIKE